MAIFCKQFLKPLGSYTGVFFTVRIKDSGSLWTSDLMDFWCLSLWSVYKNIDDEKLLFIFNAFNIWKHKERIIIWPLTI